MTDQQTDRDHLRENAAEGGAWGAVVLSLLDQLEQAERDRDWLFRSSRLSKKERIKANARADQSEARVSHLEDTARVLVKEVIAAEGARDEYRRGKVAAEARIKAVEDVLDTWMTYCQTEQTARALSDIRRALEG